MALNPQRPAPRPPIVDLTGNITPTSDPQLHWYGDPAHRGGPWTPDADLPGLITEIAVHWEDGPAPTPPGLPEPAYRAMLGQVARYHAFDRNWGDADAIIHGDGIMYHYAIAPPPHGSTAAIIYQVTAETKRTWNAYQDNTLDLAVCLMAGRADTFDPAMAHALGLLLTWFTEGRADLPLVTRSAQTVLYQGKPRTVLGVATHDETLRRQGRPLKGCCGIYARSVIQWRAGIPI